MCTVFLAAAVDFIGNLGNFLFLQGLGHFDEVGGQSFLAGQVEVAHVAQAHDVVPMQVFLEDVQHLFLLYHFVQYQRILFIGDAEQEAIVILHEVKEINEAGAGQEVAVVVIYRVS